MAVLLCLERRNFFSGQPFLLPQFGCSTGKFTWLQPAPAAAAALQPRKLQELELLCNNLWLYTAEPPSSLYT
ncbi:hypothetical protein D4764_10G0004840 [Takifugu flavidus]|uniref:Uncharacterized protein n=1 Tax=Takifugu flavidus TaxID=433684 RepID=A0A5C6PI40_9TELE|nr:hypothetical protein D4764_10G0004840 [Takifugu flavidus]